MSKKTFSPTKITTVTLAVVLVLSSFAGTLNFAGGQSPIFAVQPAGSASEIAALEATVEANGDWNASLQTIYDGIALGETSVDELLNAVNSISVSSTAAAESVFYWNFELSKFGVNVNTATLEAALNQVQMLPNVGGLPNDYSIGGTASFIIYNRFDLYAYQWAAQLGYETSKWNLNAAYTVFNNAVDGYGKPIFYVEANGNGTAGEGYGSRYYDECAETFDMYLTFWLLGIPTALSQAENWWSWTNANLWNTTAYSGGSFYEYANDWRVFECEMGGMDQLAWKLDYYDPSMPNVNNLFTDMETRLLSQGWSSPGWKNYTAVHAAGLGSYGDFVNAQERLENTVMYWGSMLGFYGNMSSTMQSQVQGLMDGSTGPEPAWSLLLHSDLYDNSSGMFSILGGSESAEGTADAAALMMLLSTVPITGALAVPSADSVYEDINNVIDGGVSSIDLATRTVTVSVSQPGAFLSMFGTDIFQYNLGSAGVWQLIFNPDWNGIAAKTLLSSLPTSRIYLGITAPASTSIYASSDGGCTINPSGLVNVNLGSSQTFTYSAASNYVLNQVLVDGSPVKITGTYTFTNIQAPHTIAVSSTSTSPSTTPTLSSTPASSPTASPTPNASTTPTASETSSSPSTQTLNPTSSHTPSTHGFSLPSIRLPELVGVIIFVAAVLAVSMLLPPYVKSRRVKVGENENTAPSSEQQAAE